jgi:hypothetical protein
MKSITLLILLLLPFFCTAQLLENPKKRKLIKKVQSHIEKGYAERDAKSLYQGLQILLDHDDIDNVLVLVPRTPILDTYEAYDGTYIYVESKKIVKDALLITPKNDHKRRKNLERISKTFSSFAEMGVVKPQIYSQTLTIEGRCSRSSTLPLSSLEDTKKVVVLVEIATNLQFKILDSKKDIIHSNPCNTPSCLSEFNLAPNNYTIQVKNTHNKPINCLLMFQIK